MDWQQTACAPMMFPVFWGLVRTPEAERDYDAINAGIERGLDVWGVLDRHLADRAFVAGDTFTMGDIPIGPQAHRWLNLVEKRPPMPNLESCIDASPSARVPEERDDPHRVGASPGKDGTSTG